MAKTNRRNQQYQNIQRGQEQAANDFNSFINPIKQRAPGERANVISQYQNFANTGGLSDAEYQQMRDAYSKNLGEGPTGANLSDFSKERAGYTNFADTGGYTGADIQRTRAQAARSAPAMFSAMKDQYNLNRANLGSNANAGAGFDFKAMRAGAQQSAQDKTAANIGLTESINAGKLQGLSGLTGIDTTMGNQSLQNASIMNAYNLAKASGASDVEARIAAMKQGGRQYGTTGLADLYGNDQADWLSAIGAKNSNLLGWQGASLTNDEVNRSKIMENILGTIGGIGGMMPGLGKLFKFGGGGGYSGTGDMSPNSLDLNPHQAAIPWTMPEAIRQRRPGKSVART